MQITFLHTLEINPDKININWELKTDTGPTQKLLQLGLINLIIVGDLSGTADQMTTNPNSNVHVLEQFMHSNS